MHAASGISFFEGRQEQGRIGMRDGNGLDPDVANNAEEAKESADLGTELAERARAGDTEAFGELIERHRGRAKGWAERMTGDPHLADDIVQDALIRAFMHIGSLQEANRFLPWLHRIVRNQANMRLRRGGPHRREKPFASFEARERDGGSVDWDNLDSILDHLTRSAGQAAMKEDDPAEHLMRKEMYETIHSVLHCLTKKERAIFEAYFFKQLSPDEIAAMYGMTTGSIYTYIHRSRQKLRQEQIRVSLGLLPEKGGAVLARHKMLELTEWPAHASVPTTMVDRLGHMLATMGDSRDMAELMGLSGFAFRMQISEKTTFADGIYMFDWRETLISFARDLGYEAALVCGQLSDFPVPLLGAVEKFPVVLPIEEAVLPFIRQTIDSGRPVLYFDTSAARPFIHEWSLICGYDDERRVVHLTDVMRPEGKTLSYEDVADNPIRFLAALTRQADRDRTASLPGTRDTRRGRLAEKTVRFAVSFAKNRWAYRPMTSYLSYATGLAAYDTWIGHLRRGPGSPPNRYGMGHLARVYSRTKSCAAAYLRTVPFEGEAMRFALLASEAYEQAAEALRELEELTPFVKTSELMQTDLCERCAGLLEQARTFEASAIGYLEKTITFLERGTSQ